MNKYGKKNCANVNYLLNGYIKNFEPFCKLFPNL